MTVDGVQRSIEIPKAHADKPVPFAPCMTFELLHNASVVIRRKA